MEKKIHYTLVGVCAVGCWDNMSDAIESMNMEIDAIKAYDRPLVLAKADENNILEEAWKVEVEDNKVILKK
jgi:hypothetical protein